MKKLLLLLISLTLVLSATFTAFAAGNEDFSDKAKEKEYKVQLEKQEKINLKKVFKQELNAQKKEIVKAKGALEEQKQELEVQYKELLTAGDTAGADALFVKISDLDTQIAEKKMQMKKIINERYMVIKSEYSDDELAQFENAAALIEKMYEDAAILGLGAITVRDNIIKFDAPAYIKGGRTIIPVRAITEELGATVDWDQDTQSVTITKENIEIVFTINSKKVYIDGVEQELDVSTEVTNGRTYVPLRFIAETFGLTVNWDDENGT
ncbi:MAG: copper amine oxidase N-terminal domain-containing protein, partial [Eubacteriales bacterium]|nr:copper amine oxidase N-terminal domain-containing protein [Eubacteriales bacterium]